MRNIMFSALLMLFAVVGCTKNEESVATPADAQPVSFNAAGLPTVEIDVPGLHCENCSATACNLLADIPGVVDVKADSETKKATLSVDQEQFDSEAARTALEEQFGEATIVGAEGSADAASTAEQS